jgi:hypothetical protein
VLEEAYGLAMKAKKCSLDRPAHEILGIEIDAECGDIRGAYQALRFVLHPDKGGDKEKVSINMCIRCCAALRDLCTAVTASYTELLVKPFVNC